MATSKFSYSSSTFSHSLSHCHLLTFSPPYLLTQCVIQSSLTKVKFWKIITCDTVFSLRCHVTTFPISRQSQIIFSHTGRSSSLDWILSQPNLDYLLLQHWFVYLLTPKILYTMMDSISFPKVSDEQRNFTRHAIIMRPKQCFKLTKKFDLCWYFVLRGLRMFSGFVLWNGVNFRYYTMSPTPFFPVKLKNSNVTFLYILYLQRVLVINWVLVFYKEGR